MDSARLKNTTIRIKWDLEKAALQKGLDLGLTNWQAIPSESKMNAEEMVKGARLEGLVQQMNALAEVRDCEDRHWQADALLCAIVRSLGYGAIVDEYDKLEKHWA